MNDVLRATLPIVGMFCGLLAIIKFYFNRIENKINRIEEKINRIEEKIGNF